MTLTFFSNFLNDHQIPLCNELYRLLGDGFRFVGTAPMTEERRRMKFETKEFPYEIRSYESKVALAEARHLGVTSEVVIRGDAPFSFISERLKRNRLTFRYTERYFKEGRWHILDPRVLLRHYKEDFRYRNMPYYLLCASAYTAPDCRFILSYPGKCLKWGYFPEVKNYDIDSLMAAKHSGMPELLWVGRMIDWKHPENAVKAAKHLRDSNLPFHMTMIGEGPMRKDVEAKITEAGLENVVELKDFMPQREVRRHMERANIFLFTSDRQEGWGAVLNEAMNSGCAVVANDEIGSVPFLIEAGVNGLTYHKSVKVLTQCVEHLLQNPGRIEQLGREAYKTMREEWNAEVAAKRLVSACDSILSDRSLRLPKEGPMSFA